MSIPSTGAGVTVSNTGTSALYFNALDGSLAAVSVLTGATGQNVQLPISTNAAYKVTTDLGGANATLATVVYDSPASVQVIAGETAPVGAGFSITVTFAQ